MFREVLKLLITVKNVGHSTKKKNFITSLSFSVTFLRSHKKCERTDFYS